MKKLIAILLIGVAVYYGYKFWKKKNAPMESKKDASNNNDVTVVNPDDLADDSDVIVSDPITFNPAKTGRPELSKAEKLKHFPPDTIALEPELIRQTGVTLSDVFYKFGKGARAYKANRMRYGTKYEGKIIFEPMNRWLDCGVFEPVLQPEGFYLETCTSWRK
jgi:hypothetical protein